MVLDDVIQYIRDKIAEDDTLPDINVLETYQYGHKVKSTEIQVQFVQHMEFQRFTTFDGIQVSVCPLLINIFATQETIDEEIVTAQRMGYMLAQKITEWFNYQDVIEGIPDVIGATNAVYYPSTPFDTGTLLYQSAVRIDLHIKNI